MIAAVALTIAALAQGALAPGEARATAARADGGEGAARVGDLVLFRVEALTAAGVALGAEPGFDVALEVVDSRASTRTRPDGARVDAFEWTLRVLGVGASEAGAIATPRVALASSGAEPIEVAPIEIAVEPALGDDEAAARPVPGFRDPADRRIGDPAVALVVLGLILLLPLAGLAFARSRSRRRAEGSAPVPITPRERLADLRPDESPAAAIGALAPIVRLLTDAARGARDGALTDEEWAERVRSDRAVPGDLSERAADLALASSAVRYGGGAPTPFAAREAKGRAEQLADALERLEATPASSVEPGAAPAEEVRP